MLSNLLQNFVNARECTINSNWFSLGRDQVAILKGITIETPNKNYM